MNTNNLYEVDLLEKYRHSISKKYRGYNRVYQLNLNKIGSHSQSIEAFSLKKQPKHSKTPIVSVTKHCFSQTHTNTPNFPKAIVIRSTNAQFSLKEVNEQTQVNNKKFTKTKLLKEKFQNQHEQNGEEVSPRDFQSSVEDFLQNKFKFRKRLVRETLHRNGFGQDGENFLKNEFMRLQPFSPVIRGEKKNTHQPHYNKKSKTQNETIYKNDKDDNDHQLNRQLTNKTENTRQKTEQTISCMKRVNSFVSKNIEKSPLAPCSQTGESIILSMSTSAQPSKLTKKFSSHFKSKEELKDKAELAKVSFPKINCAQKQTLKTNQTPLFVPLLELEKNKEKFRKTPLLLRYPFDVKGVDSQSFIVFQAQSQAIVYGYRYNNGYEIASLTKIMTFYVILKLVEELKIDLKKQSVQVEHASSNIGGTSADLFPGQIYTLESLIYGLMLPSGNDAALTLAGWGGKFKASNPEDIEACIGKFVTLMNKQAKNLNLIDTRFGNPHGLPHKFNRSTAFDVAKLSIECMKNQLFRKVVSTKSYKCVAQTSDGRKRFNEWQNTNKLLRRQGFTGIKTGITVAAGPCLASAFHFRQKTYICVLLRAKKISRRFKQTRKILHWCLDKLYKDFLTPEETLKLNKLKRNNAQLDSDYSEDESVFCYNKNNSKEYRKRCDMISDM